MLRNYLKLAFKVLLRRKFFTFISLFGISITLAVMVVVAAIVESALGPMAPETRFERTLAVTRAELAGEQSRRTSGPGYALLRQTILHLPGAETASISTSSAAVTTNTAAGKFTTYLRSTDAQFWQIFQFEFVEGAPFNAEDDKNGALVAVINEATRERFFGATAAVGRTLQVGEKTYTVAGVVRNVPIDRRLSFSDVWVPIGADPAIAANKELVGECLGLVLAKDSADMPRLQDEFQSRLRSIQIDERPYTVLRSRIDPSSEALARLIFDADENALRSIVLFLTILGVLFMFLPTINLVNINVCRILERASEIGVRKAFGASSATLVGQFVVENIVLTIVGGALALGMAFAALAILNSSGLIPYSQITLNGRVFAVALGATLFFGIVSGVYPAWRMSRLNPVEALRGAVR